MESIGKYLFELPKQLIAPFFILGSDLVKFNTEYTTYKRQFRSFILNIIIAILVGSIFKIINLEKISNVIEIYFNIYLVLIGVLLSLFIKELILYKKSKDKIVEYWKKVVGIFTYIHISLETTISKSIFDLVITIVIVMVFWFMLHVIILKIKPRGILENQTEKSDKPIFHKSKLLQSRHQDLKNIKQIIKQNDYNEPFALLINGEWGVGKTSLINVLRKDLLDEGNYLIFIQPMVLDDTEKLLEYFFREINVLFENEGIYTGKGSSFNKYFEVAMLGINTIQGRNIFNIYRR